MNSLIPMLAALGACFIMVFVVGWIVVQVDNFKHKRLLKSKEQTNLRFHDYFNKHFIEYGFNGRQLLDIKNDIWEFMEKEGFIK
jgi:hypothetical protein